MGTLNKTCLVCGSNYHYCYTCPSDLRNPSWKNIFDVENCKDIFNILSKHGQGMISDEEAKELLGKCDLSQKETFSTNIKNHIDRIVSVKKVNNDEMDKETEDNNVEEVPVINETVLEEIATTEELVENPTTIFPKYRSNKKNKKNSECEL